MHLFYHCTVYSRTSSRQAWFPCMLYGPNLKLNSVFIFFPVLGHYVELNMIASQLLYEWNQVSVFSRWI